MAVLRRLFIRRPSPALLVACVALFVALDGPATAKRWIEGGDIRPNSITSKQIRNGAIGTADLSKAAQRALRTPGDASVSARQIGPGAVDTGRLAEGAVTASKLADGAVTATKVAPNAIGASQLAPGAVGAGNLASGAIGASAVADGSLTTSDVGSFTGAVNVTFETFTPGSCQVAEFAPQPAGGAQAMSYDDVVAVSPAAGWPDPLVVTGKAAAGNRLRIVACYVAPADAGSPAPSLTNVSTTFRYVTFDAP